MGKGAKVCGFLSGFLNLYHISHICIYIYIYRERERERSIDRYGAGQHNWPHWHGVGKFIAFKFYLSYGHQFCRDCSLICYLPKILKVKLFSNNRGQKTPVMLAVVDFSQMEISSWMFALSLHRFLTSKRGHFFNFLQEWNFRIVSLTEENLKKREKASWTQ